MGTLIFMNKEESIINSLSFIKDVRDEIAKAVRRLLDVADAVRQRSERIRTSMPYYINVIDELYINENGHSRILTKLLQYRNCKGEYEILQSFLDFVKSLNISDEFADIRIQAPTITQEKERIDLWVRDEGYALIFENKVYNAADQEAQLCRYIEKTAKMGYRAEQIYVFYLPQYQHNPDQQTWGNTKNEEQFKSRFAILSFREYILPWLKTEVLPNIRQRDHLLLSALAQYVDYLEGLFKLREIDKPYNMELQDIITKQLGLTPDTSPREQLEVLDKNLSDLNDLQRQMQQMRSNAYEALFKQYVEKWAAEFVAPQQFTKCRYTEKEYFAVKFISEEKETYVYIGFDGKLYCQIEYDSKLSDEERKIEKNTLLPIIRPTLNKENWWCIWRYFDATDFNGVYNCFKNVVKTISEQL